MKVTTALKAEMIEQIMRISSEDIDVIGFLDKPFASREALSELGRLLANNELVLKPGCPLIAWAKGETYDYNWRMYYPAGKNSLWENYLFLEQIYGPAEGETPYEKLESLRLHETDELN